MKMQQILDAQRLVDTQFPSGDSFLTGSILTVPETAHDIDFVVRASPQDVEDCVGAGWTLSTKDYDNLVRYCVRMGDVNVIAVITDTEYVRWKVATAALVALHGAEVELDKVQRAALFMAVRGAIE